MKITLQRRAKIALRSLEPSEQTQILKALKQIELVEKKNLGQIPTLKKLKKLSRDLEGNTKNFYVFRGNHELRLILSIEDHVCIVEDIVAHDQLNRLFASLKQ